MKRTLVFSLVAAAASLAAFSDLRAEERALPKGYLYFAPSAGAAGANRARQVAADRPALNQPATVAQSTTPAVASSPRVSAVRPVSWGPRAAIRSVYPSALYAQYGAPASGYPANPNPGTYYQTNPYLYSYAGRSTGDCYSSSAYNSGYYGSGCYQSNSCCRTSRRLCSPFGGLFRGCGSGCYAPQAAPCQTTCYADPCSSMRGGSSYAPPAYGTPTMAPTPAPSAPVNSDGTVAPPQPVETKVAPSPQARNLPRWARLPSGA